MLKLYYHYYQPHTTYSIDPYLFTVQCSRKLREPFSLLLCRAMGRTDQDQEQKGTRKKARNVHTAPISIYIA